MKECVTNCLLPTKKDEDVWGGFSNTSARSNGGSRPPGVCVNDDDVEYIISVNCL